MPRLLAGMLMAASFLGAVVGQNPPAPDLAYIAYPKYGETDFTPVPAVLKRIDRARMKLTAVQSRLLLEQLFKDRIPGIDYIAAALNLGAEVTPEQKTELIAREKAVNRDPEDTAAVCERIATMNVPKNEMEGYPSFTEGLYRFSVLDLDGDGRADLILISAMYFGPSAGLKFYGREGDRFVYLGEHSGDIRRIDEAGSSIVFRFQVNILDPSETGVMLNIGFDRSRASWTVTRQFYAQQTELFGRMSPPRASRTIRACELRTAPRVVDVTPPPSPDGGEVTVTLKGNVVARFAAGADCFILAVRGEWIFAAFRPEAKPVESSLSHGLDHTLDRARKEIGASPIPGYICGWVRSDALEKAR
jgi:hypothetical protein